MIEVIRGILCEELTYLYIDETTGYGFVIDPGADGERLANYIHEKGYVIEKILLTHGHGDHIYGAERLRALIGATIIMHKEGKAYVTNPDWNLSYMLCGEAISFEADEYLEHGEEIQLEVNPSFKVQLIHVPGHTTDGACYYAKEEGIAFVGDTIFAGSVGRSDFPGGNTMRLMSTIRAQIFTLPEQTILYPGHGPSTTVRREIDTNPVFNMFDE